MGKWLHGTAVLSRRSVRLLLALLEGPLPSKQSNPSKGHSLAPTLLMLQSPCASWDGSHASGTCLLSLVCVIAGCSAPPPPVRPSISSTINHGDIRGVGGPTRQRSAMKKGHQALVLLASQLDRFIIFFLLSIRLF